MQFFNIMQQNIFNVWVKIHTQQQNTTIIKFIMYVQ